MQSVSDGLGGGICPAGTDLWGSHRQQSHSPQKTLGITLACSKTHPGNRQGRLVYNLFSHGSALQSQSHPPVTVRRTEAGLCSSKGREMNGTAAAVVLPPRGFGPG